MNLTCLHCVLLVFYIEPYSIIIRLRIFVSGYFSRCDERDEATQRIASRQFKLVHRCRNRTYEGIAFNRLLCQRKLVCKLFRKRQFTFVVYKHLYETDWRLRYFIMTYLLFCAVFVFKNVGLDFLNCIRCLWLKKYFFTGYNWKWRHKTG